MSTAGELLAHLKAFEGFVGHPYYCAAGKLTLGYGHRIEGSERRNITEAEATILLMEDIADYTMGAVELSPVLKNVGGRRLNAVIDFCFNCGLRAYALSQFKKAVDAQNWPEAARQIERWVYVKDPKTKVKNKSAWQVKRRAVCANWLRTG